VKECVHIDTGRYYAAKVINKRLMSGREHMVCAGRRLREQEHDWRLPKYTGPEWDRGIEEGVAGPPEHPHPGRLFWDYEQLCVSLLNDRSDHAPTDKWCCLVYLVTDLALGGELFDRICRKGSYYESDAADLIRAVLSAVAYLHDHGIVHRDLKPENLLFRTPEDNADLLIADFGLSRIMDEEQFHVLTTTCGTPGYMAPEIFKKSGHGKPV
jgi:calcium/calmodulin-dependent protein kinase I